MTYKELRALFLRRFSLPKERSIREILRFFTMAEKAVFYFFTTIFIVSGLTLMWKVSNAYLVEIPVQGGTLTEGVVGNPRFINPVLAISEADKNLTALIYSGLVYITPNNKIENDLIDKLTISDDRLIYTAHIHENARFHDGTPVTADDEFSFSQFNTLPIGAGLYKVERVERNSGGIPNFYRLTPFANASHRAPFINSLVFKF